MILLEACLNHMFMGLARQGQPLESYIIKLKCLAQVGKNYLYKLYNLNKNIGKFSKFTLLLIFFFILINSLKTAIGAIIT